MKCFFFRFQYSSGQQMTAYLLFSGGQNLHRDTICDGRYSNVCLYYARTSPVPEMTEVLLEDIYIFIVFFCYRNLIVLYRFVYNTVLFVSQKYNSLDLNWIFSTTTTSLVSKVYTKKETQTTLPLPLLSITNYWNFGNEVVPLKSNKKEITL